ncbi:zinc ribbon domain-containing protein [Butyricicoccus faecihominis]|uniref:zinc ribbon domain-containing protein n=1 Tax=Butyricicoccus faecihominis TaxID=1712515 RepID=UPI002ED66A78
MNYEIVTLPERRIVGLATRAANNAADCAEKIGRLWADFMGGGAYGQLEPSSENAMVYGAYTNYNWEEMSYDVIAGCESGTCPAGFTEVVIPAGKYAKFSFHGDVRESTAKAWDEIWKIKLPRAFGVDFEEYVSCGDSMEGDINIYIGLADICQCCGMPMTKDADYGTEADGAKSADYCCYCYQKGAFTADCTMEEMIEICLNVEGSEALYTDKEAARLQMLEYFPSLKRWKK